jgi:hypothetical protein
MKYGIILGGNSSDSIKVFTLQKKIVRLMVGVKAQNLQILLLPCEYIFSLINLIIYNQERFQTNSAIHGLHRPIANLSCFQKSAYYAGIEIFNNLPSGLMNEKA